MTTLYTHQSFDLVIYEVDQWALPPHKHLFFELVYVLEGTGKHVVNQQQYPYQPGSLFLLTPADTHAFEVQTTSQFCIIVFTKLYFARSRGTPDAAVDFGGLFQRLEYVFLNHSATAGEPVMNPADKRWVGQLVQRLMEEVAHKGRYYEPISQQLMLLLLNHLARAIEETNRLQITTTPTSDLVYEVMTYIQQHIYDNAKLRVEQVASQFAKSKSYLSQHFKAQTGETLKAYILGYKLHLAKARLLHSDLTVAQIADELGFTDESHLNKTVKQRYGLTAKELRRAGNAGNPPVPGGVHTTQ